MEKFRLGILWAVVSGLILLAFSGCAMMKKPDSCDQEKLCELNTASEHLAVRLGVGESKDIEICACRPWNNSGIQVAAGQRYSFKIMRTENWVDGRVASHPIDGWQGPFYKTIGLLSGWLKRTNAAPWYALAGSVGKDDKGAFAVVEGVAGAVTMDASGVLYFFANDMEGRYFNNRGKLVLRVQRAQLY